MRSGCGYWNLGARGGAPWGSASEPSPLPQPEWGRSCPRQVILEGRKQLHCRSNPGQEADRQDLVFPSSSSLGTPLYCFLLSEPIMGANKGLWQSRNMVLVSFSLSQKAALKLRDSMQRTGIAFVSFPSHPVTCTQRNIILVQIHSRKRRIYILSAPGICGTDHFKKKKNQYKHFEIRKNVVLMITLR